MNKTPEQYAQMIMELCFNNKDIAKRECINAIQQHKDKVSIDFWYAVINHIWLQ